MCWDWIISSWGSHFSKNEKQHLTTFQLQKQDFPEQKRVPSREESHIPPWKKEKHLQQCIGIRVMFVPGEGSSSPIEPANCTATFEPSVKPAKIQSLSPPTSFYGHFWDLKKHNPAKLPTKPSSRDQTTTGWCFQPI